MASNIQTKCALCSFPITGCLGEQLSCGHILCWRCSNKEQEKCPVCSVARRPGNKSSDSNLHGHKENVQQMPNILRTAVSNPGTHYNHSGDIKNNLDDHIKRKPDTRSKSISALYEPIETRDDRRSSIPAEYISSQKSQDPPPLPMGPRPNVTGNVSIFTSKKHLCWMKSFQYGVEDVAFLPNGSIFAIISDTGVNKPVLFDQSGKTRGMPFNITNVTDPSSIAVHVSSSKVALTDSSSGTFIILSQNGSSWEGQVFKCGPHPRTITFCGSKAIIIGTGLGQRLKKFDISSGSLVWNHKVQHYCSHITVDSLYRILVSDYDTGQVHVYDTDANKLFSFPAKSNKMSLKEPRGLISDTDNNLLIADFSKMCVSSFNSNGQFTSVAQKTTNKPICVDIWEEEYMVIGTDRNVLLFRIVH